MKRLIYLAFLVLFAVVLGACAQTTSPPASTPVPPTVTVLVVPTDPPTPPPYPSARHDSTMAFDGESNVVILFGGGTDAQTAYNDTWAYETSTNTWTQMAPSPEEGGWGALAYDAESDRVVYYLASIVSSDGVVKEAGETLTYDFNNDRWERMELTEAPVGRETSRLVYDSESDRMILFGGRTWTDNPSFFDETWSYDLNTNTWTKMNPAVSPAERFYYAMTYLPSLDRVVLFGGLSPNGRPNNDTWLYDYNSDSWEEVEILEAPSARAACGVYAAALDQMILFGGAENLSSKIENDTWMFDHDANTWIEMSPDSDQSKRFWHSMAYDSTADKLVLFGGGPDWDHPTNETWIYDPQTNTWANMTPDE